MPGNVLAEIVVETLQASDYDGERVITFTVVLANAIVKKNSASSTEYLKFVALRLVSLAHPVEKPRRTLRRLLRLK